MRERPQPHLLLGDLPEAGKAGGLHDQEEDDQAAEDDELQVGDHGVRDLEPGGMRDPARDQVEEDREQGDEGRTEESAENRPYAPDDDHEQDPKREVQAVGLGLDRA